MHLVGKINRSMLYFLLKIFITAMIVVVVAEIAKRSSLLAGLIVSIPLIGSVLFANVVAVNNIVTNTKILLTKFFINQK